MQGHHKEDAGSGPEAARVNRGGGEASVGAGH